MKKLKSIFTSLALAIAMLAPVAMVGQVASAQLQTNTADPSQSLQQGTCLNTTSGCSTTASGDKVNSLVATIINIFSWVVGVISVIMIIYGGFKYITSGGDAGGVTGAKNTILYAIVGLVIVALAQVIVQFVLGKVTG